MAPEAITPAERLELLIRGGEVLYGPNWQQPLARGLGINVRTIQRWVAHESGYPPLGLLYQLIELCHRRTAQIEKMRVEIALRLPPIVRRGVPPG
jgi:hypothetical protein